MLMRKDFNRAEEVLDLLTAKPSRVAVDETAVMIGTEQYRLLLVDEEVAPSVLG